MKNFVGEGNVINFRAPAGGVVGGQPYCLGDIPVVIASDAEEGDLVAAPRRGVFELPVYGHNGTEAVAILDGIQIYYDTSGETPVLNANIDMKPYGKILSRVEAGETKTVEVILDE
ncbi:MAG: DUF2190 family protein [Desulfobacteraceae bacterium]